MGRESDLSGVYTGSLFTMYEDEAWKCSFDLIWDDTGRITGSGYFTSGEDFELPEEEPVSVVFLGQIIGRGDLYAMIIAPQRFETGVWWVLDLSVDLENRTLEGEVLYSEVSLDFGEPGRLFLQHQ